ncbi:hypothetical protein GCM10022378_11190 [Salinicoccus jeotgali]|uniref:HNH nuclease domain-containing protein n=1 Tax=Salinicoccus jeotgali TaxID=381634 RepID=A0ABP7ESH7_9STAP
MNEKQLSRKSIKNKKNSLLEIIESCEICGFDFKPTLEVHHQIPVSRGGTDDIENLSILCPNCHSLIHAITSDNSKKVFSCEEMDQWLKENFNRVQRDKVFYYSMRLLRTGDENE